MRGIEGKLGAIRYAREKGIPPLGLCLGLQCMVIEYARNVAGLDGASSAEFEPETPHPVIATMADQLDVVAGERDMGGTMRLGLYPANLAEGSLVRETYGNGYVEERHRHRYEVNNDYRARLEAAGLRFSGTVARRQARRVRRARPRRTPLLRRHAGAPRAALTPDPRPPAVPRAHRGGARTSERDPARAAVDAVGLAAGSRMTIADEERNNPVVNASVAFEGRVWNVRQDDVDLGEAGIHTREYIGHPGAVAIIAVDDSDRVLLVRQYRHPVRQLLWEPPAGLCDIDGEDPLETGRRELWEETGWEAATWDLLVAPYLSPGSSSEQVVVYLARDVRTADGERHVGHGEELGMETAWVPLDEVVDGIVAGRLHNPSLIMGVLTLLHRRSRGELTARA